MTAINPIDAIEYRGTVCPVKTYTGNLSSGNNQSLVAAVTGKKIAVIRIWGQSSNAAIGAVRLKSNSGGTTIMESLWFPLATTAGERLLLPWQGIIYCETTAGHALVADVATDNVNLSLNYIEYTP